MSTLNFITDTKKNTTFDIIFLIIIFLFPIFFLSSFALNLSLIIISIYFLSFVFKYNYYEWIKHDISKVILIFWIYLVLNSIFLNSNGSQEVIKTISYIRFILFFFAISFILPKLKIKFEKIFLTYLIISTIFSIDIIIQFIFEKNILGFPCQMGCQRNASFFKEELVAGTFILHIGVIGLLYFFFKKNNKFFFISASLIAISIFLTGDRNPFLMMLIIIFLNTWLNQDLRNKLIKIYSTIFIALVLLITFSKDIKDRYLKNTYNIFNSSELNYISLKSWVSLYDKQITFLEEVREKDYSNSNSSEYEEDEGKFKNYKFFVIYTEEPLFFLQGKSFDEIRNNHTEILIVALLNEQAPLIKRLEKVKKINEFRKKNNSQDAWYNNFIDSQYGALYLTAINIFLENPIFGSGFKSYRIKCKDYGDINSYSVNTRCSTHPHHLHLQLLSEVGLVGYIIFILIIFVFFKSYNETDADTHNKGLYILIFSLFISEIFPFKPSGSFFSSSNSTYFWLSFSIFYLIKHLRSVQK